ncbi:class I SAM-dependent methyltransferase [Streptomyces roseolilacinus]|uniref:SAM-dependent methyltransferase n=1 Tax=Streptomyces roseolilacinus TaxID=66904 RepID=A0A918AZ85_9ACTN|nr:class I SAM-dependent methyltransferase [Streptomyces roseolilacinus]GGQ03777.1 SAM-dependent methyltransferase [Streptomyces roseolilacinus]
MTGLDTAVTAYWDSASASFDEEPDHGLLDPRTRDAWRERLRRWTPGGACDVLDAGCGTGSLALLLAEDGHRVTGVDLAPRMVARAKAKFVAAGLPGRFLVGDAARPPVGERRFDVVLVRHLVWTLPDPEAALRAWAGLLRSGGRLVLVEGRWGEAGREPEPYVPGGEALPWGGGVPADVLAGAVAPLAREVRVEPLDGDAALWGRPVDDERYALLAWAGA